MNLKFPRQILIAASCVALLASPYRVLATNYTWTGTTNNSWVGSTNWSPTATALALSTGTIAAIANVSANSYITLAGGATTTAGAFNLTTITSGTTNAFAIWLIGSASSDSVFSVTNDLALSASGKSLFFKNNSASAALAIQIGGNVSVTNGARIQFGAGAVSDVFKDGLKSVTVTGSTSIDASSSITLYNDSSNAGAYAFNGGIANSGTLSLFVGFGLGSTRSGTSGQITIAGLTGSGITQVNDGNIISGSNTAIATLTLNGSGSSNYTGILRDSGQGGGALSIVMAGSGTQVLSGMNTYTGTTTITAGTLLINGSHSSAGAYTVTSGGILGGSGSISGGAGATFAIGSMLSPGATGLSSSGTLTTAFSGTALDISGLTSGTGGLIFDLSAPGTSDEVLLTSGTLKIGTMDLNDYNFNYSSLTNGTYTLFDTNASIIGSISGITTETIGNKVLTLGLNGTGDDIDLIVTTVPEPHTAALLLSSCAFLFVMLRRPFRNRRI